MIKVETKVNDDVFSVQYEAQNTSSMEHLMLISNLIEKILENTDDVKEKDIIKFIKNRQKFFDKLEESEGEE